MADIQCPNCGSASVGATGHCTRCGTQVRGPAAASPEWIRGPAAPPVQPGWPGAAQPERPASATPVPLFCPECGAVAEAGSTFCPFCGTSLGEQAAAAATLTQPTWPVTAGPAWGQGLPEAATAKRQPWGFVWAAAALVVVVGVLIAGVTTSWFGLAGRDEGAATTLPYAATSRTTTTAAYAVTQATATTQAQTSASTTVPPTSTTYIPLPTTTVPNFGSGPVITACVVGSDGATVNVRSGPSEFTTRIGSLASNATGIQTTGRTAWDHLNEEWREVNYGGQEAWVHTYFLSPGQCTVASPRSYCVDNYNPPCSPLNVRTGPEADNWGHIDEWLRNGYAIIGQLAYNATGVQGTGVTAQDYEGDLWVQIYYGGGVGWAYADYLAPAPCTPACP